MIIAALLQCPDHRPRASGEVRSTTKSARQLSAVLSADRLVAIDRGRIVEEGTHADLLAADGLYARLCARQLAR